MHVRVVNDLALVDGRESAEVQESSESPTCFTPCYTCEPDGTCVVGVSQCCPRYPPLPL